MARRSRHATYTALIYLRDGDERPEHILGGKAARDGKSALDLFRDGRIVEVARLRPEPIMSEPESLFGSGFLNGRTGVVPVRNDLAHLNMMWRAAREGAHRQPLNLSTEVAGTRRLMAYDRKLKNAVTKSVIDALAREKIGLAWEMSDHEPCNPTLWADQARHFKHPRLAENLHDPLFLGMVAEVFGGTVAKARPEVADRDDPGQLVEEIFGELEDKKKGGKQSRRGR